MRFSVGVVIATLFAVAACGGDDAAAGAAEPTRAVEVSPTATPSPVALPVPRFEVATGPTAALIGTVFDESTLPPALVPDPVGGGAIINAATDPADEETVAMFWAVRDDHANFVVATLFDRDPSGSPSWLVKSAWVLRIDPASYVTIGTHVCMPPPASFNGRDGEFVAVTGLDWNVAFGAWTMTIEGPEPYGDLAGLLCEKFTT